MRIPRFSDKTVIFIAAAFAAGIVIPSFILGLTFYASTANLGIEQTFDELSASLGGRYSPYQAKPAQESPYSLLEAIGRMMVYTAHLNLEVSDVDSAIVSIHGIAMDLGGNVTSISTSKESGRRMGVVTIRVPQESFYDAIQAIENLGDVGRKEVKGEDVTEQYVDLSARLSNLKKQEQRLIEILEMCTTVQDVLKVESELNRVREQVEQLTGQIQYLESRIDLATIIVSLGEPGGLIAIPQINWGRPVEAGLWGVFVVFQGLIALAIVATPFIAIGTPIYYVYRRRQTKNKASP